MVVDVKDPVRIKVGKAYIILEDGVKEGGSTKIRILNYLSKKSALKPYEIPNSITFVKEFPQTKAKKIDYEALRSDAKNARDKNI